VLAVPVRPGGGHRPDAGVRAVPVHAQQHLLQERVRDVVPAGHRRDRGPTVRAQHRLLERVDQRHHAPPLHDHPLEQTEILRFGHRIERAELDRPVPSAWRDLQKVQVR
jgi:hypothetical protein